MPNLRNLIAIAALATLAACSGGAGDSDFPDPDRADRAEPGVFSEDEGGLTVFERGGRGEQVREPATGRAASIRRVQDDSPTGGGVGVNGFLWRATLDTLSFIPIESADPFGGVIISDWYTPPGVRNERFKINAFVLTRDLRADGIRVSVFRQALGRNGQWLDAAVSDETAAQIERTILTRARQLRIGQPDED